MSSTNHSLPTPEAITETPRSLPEFGSIGVGLYREHRRLATTIGIANETVLLTRTASLINPTKYNNSETTTVKESIPMTFTHEILIPYDVSVTTKDSLTLFYWTFKTGIHTGDPTSEKIIWLLIVDKFFPGTWSNNLADIQGLLGPIQLKYTDKDSYLDYICLGVETDIADYTIWVEKITSDALLWLPGVIMIHFLVKMVNQQNMTHWITNRVRALSTVMSCTDITIMNAILTPLKMNDFPTSSPYSLCSVLVNTRKDIFLRILANSGPSTLMGSVCSYFMVQFQFASMNFIQNVIRTLTRYPWMFIMPSMQPFIKNWSDITKFLGNFNASEVPYLRVIYGTEECRPILQASYQTMAALFLKIMQLEYSTQNNQSLDERKVDKVLIDRAFAEFKRYREQASVSARFDTYRYFGVEVEQIDSFVGDSAHNNEDNE